MGVEIAEADGKVREPVIAYYEERARGGAGLIITENTCAMYPRGANSAHELGVSNDEFLPGLRALTERVHRHGARIAIQLAHHGKVARLDTQEARPLLMPSKPRRQMRPTGPIDLSGEEMMAMAKAAGGGKPIVEEASREDLRELVCGFADAAERAQRASFDGVEIHAAHGYIFSEFLSPAWNFREDEYGGPLENRARLLLETLAACKEATGGEFPVWCRIDAMEFGEGDGIQLNDAQKTARLAEAAGADAIHVSAYANPFGAGFTEAPIVHREGGFVEMTATIRESVSVPVIAVGRISPGLGDELIRAGKADLIAMGRQMLADPATAGKLAADEEESIRPCVYCYTCVAQAFFDRSVRCAVNPVTAFEAEFAARLREKAPNQMQVLIAGGGPAGLEAARVAAERGHRVTLFEKEARLGGTLRFAALVYEPNERLLNWLETRVKALGVEIRLNEELSVSEAQHRGADTVLVAPGARRRQVAIPGAELPHVLDGDSLRALMTGGDLPQGPRLKFGQRWILAAGRLLGLMGNTGRLRSLSHYFMPIGRNVVIVGGGLVGIELAEFLVDRGRKVSVLEEGEIFAKEMAHPRRWRALHDVRSAGVDLTPSARVERITKSAVEYSLGTSEGGRENLRIPAQSVIITLGLESNPDLAAGLEAAGLNTIEIGDCTGVGYLEGAIREGFHAALALEEAEAKD